MNIVTVLKREHFWEKNVDIFGLESPIKVWFGPYESLSSSRYNDVCFKKNSIPPPEKMAGKENPPLKTYVQKRTSKRNTN